MWPTDDSDWSIEAIDDPQFSHVIGFSDFVAHQREDLVAQVAAWLADRDEIATAVHEDREAVFIDAAGSTSEELEAIFGPWWEQILRQPPPWKEQLAVMATAVHEVLKPAGFKKRKNLFNRLTASDVKQVVELYRVDDRVRVEVGLYLHRVQELRQGDSEPMPEWIGEPSCHLRDPYAVRIPGDRWLVGYEISTGVQDTVEHVRSVVVPWLETMSTTSDVLEACDRGRRRIGDMNERVVAGLLLADQGLVQESTDLFQAAFDETTPAKRPGILLVAQRQGVGPLVTGADPDLSVADEEVLQRWIDGEEQVIRHLVDVIARYRVPIGGRIVRRYVKGTDLDGSVASVERLWQWVVASVPVIDRLISDPDPIDSRYRSERTPMSAAEMQLAEWIAAYLTKVLRVEHPTVRWRFNRTRSLVLEASSTVPLLDRIDGELVATRDPNRGERYQQLLSYASGQLGAQRPVAGR